MKRPIGYILAALGLIGLAIYAVPEVAEFAALPGELTNTVILIISIILIALGIFFIMRGGRGRQSTEVPIYRGKEVVGYRRH